MTIRRARMKIHKLTAIAAVLILAALLCAAKPWSSRQDKAHQIAELARDIGLDDDHAIIQEAQTLWWAETEDARILANVLAHECPYCSDRQQELTAQVVLNRVADPRFPDSIRAVVEQPGQYHVSYTQSLPDYASSGTELRRCFDAAIRALMGEVECPSDVIYQSQFKALGAGTYEAITVDTGAYRSTTYFNYG